MEWSAGLRPAAARSAERAQEIPWIFRLLNVLRLTEPRSAVAEINFRFGCGADIPVCRFWGLSSPRIPRQTISFGRRSWKTSQPAGSKARPTIWATRPQDVPDGGMSAGLQLMFPVFFAF
jgi:hypothetical protein